MTIAFKPIQSFFTEDDKAVVAGIKKLTVNGPALRAKRDALTAAIDKGEKPAEPDIKARIANLIDGKPVAPVASLEAQRLEVLYAIRDNEDGLDFLFGKKKIADAEAGRKMVEAAKTQIVASEKAIYDTVQTLFNAFLPYWLAKRELLNNSIGTYGLFGCPLDEILGVPAGVNSAWSDLFRHAVERGHLKMPNELMPK